MTKYKNQIGLDIPKKMPHEVTHRIAWTSPGIYLLVLYHMQHHHEPGEIKRVVIADLESRNMLCNADRVVWASDGKTMHIEGIIQDVLTFDKQMLWPFGMAVRVNEYPFKGGYKEQYIYLLTRTGVITINSRIGDERYNDSYSRGFYAKTTMPYTHKDVEEALTEDQREFVESIRSKNGYVPN